MTSPNFRASTTTPDSAGANPTRPATDDAPSAETLQLELTGLRHLMSSEEQVRSARGELELIHLIVNETRRIAGARQVFLLRRSRAGKWQAIAVSSLALVDRDTPLVRWVEAMAGRLAAQADISRPVDFTLPAFAADDADETKSYPFRQLCWHPLTTTGGDIFAGLVAAREKPWRSGDVQLLTRQASVYAHAWQAIHGAGKLRPKSARRRWLLPALILSGAAVGAIPVPLTTLAPVEIVAESPEIVTAPIDGVIKSIAVEPNRPIAAGTVLFRYDDTVLTNRFELADREMQVARARFEQAERAALYDEKARHELLIARTGYELKKAERDYADTLRSKAVVSARQDGLLIYTSKDEWLGRPVTTGEKVMSVANPARVLARIELPVADAIVLAKGADARLFLDASPLVSLPATLVRESYHATPNSAHQLVYTLHARIAPQDQSAATGNEGNRPLPRIGARGTAQLFGAKVPLAFMLLRRPVAFLRQSLGI